MLLEGSSEVGEGSVVTDAEVPLELDDRTSRNARNLRELELAPAQPAAGSAYLFARDHKQRSSARITSLG